MFGEEYSRNCVAPLNSPHTSCRTIRVQSYIAKSPPTGSQSLQFLQICEVVPAILPACGFASLARSILVLWVVLGTSREAASTLFRDMTNRWVSREKS